MSEVRERPGFTRLRGPVVSLAFSIIYSLVQLSQQSATL